MAELIFKRDFPDILRPEFNRFFNQFAEIIPNWVNTVIFHYSAQPENYEALLEVITRTEYRIVEVVVYAQYIELDNEIMRQKSVLHEFCHVFSAALHRQAIGLADLLGDETAMNLAYEGIRCANEALTEDTTNMVYSLLKRIENLEAELSKKQVSKKVYNYVNEESAIEDFLNTSAGQKSILNVVNQNKAKAIIKSNRKAPSTAAKVAKPRKKKG